MSEPELIRRQREALRRVLELAADRDRAEVEAKESRSARDSAAESEYRKLRKAIEEQYSARKQQTVAEDEARRRAIEEAARSAESAAKTEFSQANRKIAAVYEQRRDQAKQEYQQAAWEINTVHETGERAAADRKREDSRRLDQAVDLLGTLRTDLEQLQAGFKKLGLDTTPPSPAPADHSRLEDPIASLFDDLGQLDEKLQFVERLAIPRFMIGARQLIVLVLPILLLLYPMIQALGMVNGAIAAAMVGLSLGFALRFWLGGVARRQLDQHVPPIAQSLADATTLSDHSGQWVESSFKTKRAELDQARDLQMNRIRKRQSQAIAEAETTRDEKIRDATLLYNRKSHEAEETRRADLQSAVATVERLRQETETAYRTDSHTLDQRYRKTRDAIAERFDKAWTSLDTTWREGLSGADREFHHVAEVVEDLCSDWSKDQSRPWKPPRDVPRVMRFGALGLDLDHLPHSLPRDPALREGIPQRFPAPALMAFPAAGNLIVESSSEPGRQAAIEVLRAVMLRLLTSLPPAKVRFTIIDPVGLGRNFGAFMHLADFDPALVHQRIWTEPEQIDDRLTDLSEHIEKVLQNYLRNEYETIEEYNAQAGEVAEPFRVLVVADFPTHFDDRSTRRLVNILASGVRCGVLVLVAVDRDKPLPDGLRLEDLRAHATNLVWKHDKLVWQDPDFGPLPLQLDSLPDPDATTRLLHQAGAAAKEASRVEVPFEFIAPPESAYWTGDSRRGVDVALGKAGATKMQRLDLGKGTAQHALVAGRTGSGKSTLFHALITNLALTYSPDEVELYLIDFKKGVEFKTYATHELPHAQVVAIESEREFGISVLQRLDGVLKERAELFRDAGVQDISGYRSSPGSSALPRVLLIVDEFQEFFIEDDKLAQEASLLLDRLVRQGRAFGVHTVLGSQTLGGAFSLARSTLGQMAVRIALQCSDTDAHLILSEENSAASLLSRPGEAVYNDANGAPDANSFFQVCWLDDSKRDAYLDRVTHLARERKPGWSRTPIVFEGNVPGQVHRNPLLNTCLEPDYWPASPRSAVAWLGDAVAIKDPTAVSFRRQAASHLLVVGQNDEAAIGVMTASLASLAVQYPPARSDNEREGARFHVLDGTPEDSPLAGKLLQAAQDLPHTTASGSSRETARIIGTVAAEVDRRQQADATEGPELFLVIHDISRFRDLRKREDDFSFGRRDEASSPADQLGTILREGPVLGIHVLVWCDNLNNLNRTFDRQALRELEQRVLFQMSPNDSSHLIDSPMASRLGPFRALYSNEEEGVQEKFRPYGPPPADWWKRLVDTLRQRPAPHPGNGSPSSHTAEPRGESTPA